MTRTTLCIRTGLSDRLVRRAIQKAREECVILNAQDGKGYYRPLKTDKQKVERWIKQEEARRESMFPGVSYAQSMVNFYE